MKKNNKIIPLNKYIADAGVCSRRKAVEYVKQGVVKINNVIVTEPGYKVLSHDKVTVNDKIVRIEQKVYTLLNKPKGYITTLSDEKGRATVIDLLKGAFKYRLFPVGRLDRLTTGLIILTNDGELAQRLSHPRFEVKKIYNAVLDQPLVYEDMETIRAGLKLTDGFIRPDRIGYITGKSRKHIKMQIHSGKNRIVRRIFKKLGYNVIKLDRVNYAGLSKKGLSLGMWRLLTKQEITMLKKHGEVKKIMKSTKKSTKKKR